MPVLRQSRRPLRSSADSQLRTPAQAPAGEAAAGTGQDTPGVSPTRMAPRAARLRVLVADDNLDVAHAVGVVLQLDGHEVDVAGDGEEALAKARATRPDFVLLDLGMPRLSGYDVCRCIRSEEWGREVVLVAQTGWGQEDDRRRTAAAGFDAHLAKPVDAVALLALIADLRAR